MRLRILVGAVMLLALGTEVCQAQNFGAPRESYLGVEWEVERAGPGCLSISGYVYNDRDFWAQDLQLLVEVLDSSGQAISSTIGYVDRTVPSGGRAYFEVRLPDAGENYRVSVHSVDWFGGPSGL